MSVLMLMHFLLDVVPLHGGIVPNCTSLVLCQFMMETFSQTVLLILGILYLTPLFLHVLLIFLNVNYIQCLFLGLITELVALCILLNFCLTVSRASVRAGFPALVSCWHVIILCHE